MQKIISLLKEYAYVLYYRTFMLFNRTPPTHYLNHIIPGKAPIIILPGVTNRWAFCKPIADHLSALGHPVYIVPELDNNVMDIPSAAKKVRQVVEKNNLNGFVIVGHSKGGLTGKYLLLNEDPEKRAKGLIAIATPFHGSSLANHIKLPFVQELTPKSKIIKYLENHPEVNGKIVSIIPSYDNIVWHEKGSFLDGALQNINVEIVGHNIMLSDKNVWERVTEWIEKI